MHSTLRLPRPDDWHHHLREGAAMQLPLCHAAGQFGRLLAMPNLATPLVDAQGLRAYSQSIEVELARLPTRPPLQVFYTLYLKPDLNLDKCLAWRKELALLAVKWYPRGVTTNSAEGVAREQDCYPLFARLEEQQLVLSIHGEVNHPQVDIFDRETVFLEQVLAPLLRDFPRLRVVLEHISTRAAVEFVRSWQIAGQPLRLAATITAHHLLINRHDMLADGIKPHLYCLPIAKRESDRQALVEAATSGEGWFFLGTDSAPHTRQAKQSACGCAGCYTAPLAMQLYARVFDAAGKLERLQDFACTFGADFYDLPPAGGELTMERAPWRVPESYAGRHGEVVPFAAGQELDWRVVNFS